MKAATATTYDALVRRANWFGKLFFVAAVLNCSMLMPVEASSADGRAFDEAIRLGILGHYGESTRILREIQRKHPNDPYVLTELGNAYLNNYNDVQSGTDKAEKCLRRALEIDPELGRAWVKLAECSDAKGDFVSGVKYATKALSVKKPDFEAYHERAGALSNLKRDKEALKDIEMFLKTNPRPERKHFVQRATIMENLKQYDRAVAEYRRLLKEKYEDQVVYREVACLQAMGKQEEAIKTLNELVAHNKQDDTGYLSRARAYESMGKHKEAIADFTKAYELQPSTAALKERAAAYEKMGRRDLADKDRKEIERL
ncbi:MAG TPA: tetratricopeptide repeat protein [Candidatus Melainabacteria bacterium]|jgi:tetratricopeptide (TPR) repeat protein|nr:tetratricopeptide repeat protein [Candidatus Melainabacteria bacterium]HIN66874.1 tetratricopeptide repeat protein [Candidatus Obscuribacterales bacterium]